MDFTSARRVFSVKFSLAVQLPSFNSENILCFQRNFFLLQSRCLVEFLLLLNNIFFFGEVLDIFQKKQMKNGKGIENCTFYRRFKFNSSTSFNV